MKYWCYYTDVVRYLERLEALYSQKKAEGPAYLVWQDDDGPSMIAGPGIEWHRGDGPPPDIDAINVRIGRPSAPRRRPSNRAASARLRSTPRPNSQDRAPQRNTASPQCRQRAASATAPGVAHRSAVPPRACGAWSGESRSTVLQDLLLDRIASVLALRWATSRSLAPNNPTPTGAPAPQKRRTKGVRIFQNPLKPAQAPAKKGEQKEYEFSKTRSNLLTPPPKRFQNPLKPTHSTARNNRAAGVSLRSKPQITSHPPAPKHPCSAKPVKNSFRRNTGSNSRSRDSSVVEVVEVDAVHDEAEKMHAGLVEGLLGSHQRAALRAVGDNHNDPFHHARDRAGIGENQRGRRVDHDVVKALASLAQQSPKPGGVEQVGSNGVGASGGRQPRAVSSAVSALPRTAW